MNGCRVLHHSTHTTRHDRASPSRSLRSNLDFELTIAAAHPGVSTAHICLSSSGATLMPRSSCIKPPVNFLARLLSHPVLARIYPDTSKVTGMVMKCNSARPSPCNFLPRPMRIPSCRNGTWSPSNSFARGRLRLQVKSRAKVRPVVDAPPNMPNYMAIKAHEADGI